MKAYIVTYRFEDGFVVDILNRGLTMEEFRSYVKNHGKCLTQTTTPCELEEIDGAPEGK